MSQNTPLQRFLQRSDFRHYLHELRTELLNCGMPSSNDMYSRFVDAETTTLIDPKHASLREGFVPALRDRDRMLEFGSSFGQAALTYLLMNPKGQFVSIDFGKEPYIRSTHEWLIARFGNRVFFESVSSTDDLNKPLASIGNFDVVYVNQNQNFKKVYTSIWAGVRRLNYDGVLIVDGTLSPPTRRATSLSLLTGQLLEHSLRYEHPSTIQFFMRRSLSI